MVRPRYIGALWTRKPCGPSGGWIAPSQLPSTTRWSGTKTSSTTTVFDPEARRPIELSPPQSSTTVHCSIGTIGASTAMRPSGSGPIEVAMKCEHSW